MTRKELKQQAKAGLKGNWGVAILATIVAGLILGAASATFVGELLLIGPISVGLCVVFTTIARAQKADFNQTFTGFSNFTNTFVTGLLYTIFLCLWACIPVVGIIKYYSYSMTFYIQMDHPEMTKTQAITASRKMMDGHKMDLFVLELSFIGWILLSCLTFGLLLFYVGPYMSATEAAFYEKLKAEQAQ